MTLVAAWIDWTNQDNPRLLCFADSRISNTATGGAVTDNSAKLFRFPIELHRLDDFDVFTGTLRAPYFSGAIGIGYAGDLILADTVTSILSQTLSNLATQYSDDPTITWHEIRGHLEGVLRAVLAGPYVPLVAMDTTFLAFGYFEGGFQIARLSASKNGMVEVQSVNLYEERYVSIGSAAANFDSRVDAAAPALRTELTLARRRFENSTELTRDEREVELAQARERVSKLLRKEFENELDGANKLVGGTMQLMEVTREFIAMRKTDSNDVLGAVGVERVGRFQALLVVEG